MVMTRVWVLEMTLKSTQETPLVFVPLCLASYALTEKMGWYSAPGNEAQVISRGILAKIVSLIGAHDVCRDASGSSHSFGIS